MGITRTVGNGTRNHTTIQAAIEYFSGYDFSSNGGGQCYIDIYPEGGGTDGEWALADSLVAPTTPPTNVTEANSLTIRAVAGQSFRDHADKLDNELRYNTANGVAIRWTATVAGFNVGINHLTIEGLQIKGGSGGVTCVTPPSGITASVVKNCILQAQAGAYAWVNISFGASPGHRIVNCVIYGGGVNYAANSTGYFIGNTIYFSGDSNNRGGLWIQWGSVLCVGNIVYTDGTSNDFRFSDGGQFASGSGYNASNDSSANSTNGTTGAVTSITMSDVFENISGGTEDYRVKAGAPSSVTTGGITRSEFGGVDVIGKARSTGTAPTGPTIGAWEFFNENIFDLAPSSSLITVGRATLSGDPASFTRYWRVPSNASVGTTARMIVFAAGSPAVTVAYEGAVTADASGNFDLQTSDASSVGTKRFALVHAWNGVTGTTSIYGGPSIGELIQVT